MQFVKNGPDIPETLLQAHEEGRVIFFCGAGIAYPAGLPGFDGLVKKLYKKLNVSFNRVEAETFGNKQYDTTIDLLERRFPGQRAAVRAVLPGILKPKLKQPGATDTHTALLELARDRNGAVRLVTTNFDRIFQRHLGTGASKIPVFQAPLLPVPKISKWNGIVYLHGLLPAKNQPDALNSLVLSSGDFGLAYLTERWASRFVSELFRNYIVCFVGYSINDPVLRYMMDALAADRMQGEAIPQAYAFGEYKISERDQRMSEWISKGVVPILYGISDDGKDHSNLHKSIQAWSETYRDGVRGKERIAAELGLTLPTTSSKEDDFVSRLLWALCDPGGSPARRFADLNPAPSLKWLQPLEEVRYKDEDLSRFGVRSLHRHDPKLAFSVLSRPAPHTLSPWMELLPREQASTKWDDIMLHLARWLLRHLDDPSLLLWIAKRGGVMHDNFRRLLDHKLNKLMELERDGKLDDLEQLKMGAPNAVPGPHMHTLWRLLLTGHIKSTADQFSLYEWQRRFARDGMTASVRQDLRRCFTPKISIRESFRWAEETTGRAAPVRLRDLVDWELTLSTEHANLVVRDLSRQSDWQISSASLVGDFTLLLKDALDLTKELGASDELNGNSHWAMPSISTHWQNRDFQEWTALIEVVRDGFLSVLQTDRQNAQLIAEDWWRRPYPLFKRLALFAASQDTIVPASRWVNWLVSDDRWWLWTTECQREVMRLLVLQGARVDREDLVRLQEAITQGPPQGMYGEGSDPERLAHAIEHGIWLRLAKLRSSGAVILPENVGRVDELTLKNNWELSKNESDEFSHWMSGTGDPNFVDRTRVLRAPRTMEALIDWLKQAPSDDPYERNDWSDFCRDRPVTTSKALLALAKQEVWPIDYWRDALQTWSAEDLLTVSWQRLAGPMLAMPDDVLQSLTNSAAWWLQAQSKNKGIQSDRFVPIATRILALEQTRPSIEADTLTAAINHPVGQITQGLLNLWLGRGPRDNDGLPDDIRPIFQRICSRENVDYAPGRLLLCANVIAFYRVDHQWSTEYLLPLFSWEISQSDALTAWHGFLWSPRLFRPLIAQIKREFLTTSMHFEALGPQQRQFASVLTYAALDPGDTFVGDELRLAFDSLPESGLIQVASTLARALSDAGVQHASYFQNRIRPFWLNVWPQDRRHATSRISDRLVRLCIAAKELFPQAIAIVHDWLQAIPQAITVLHELAKSGLCLSHPREALDLLFCITDMDDQFIGQDFIQCLEQIVEAWPAADEDRRYQRLSDLAARQRA